MNQDVRNYVTQKVKELVNAPTCCAEAKAVAQSWLDAVGTDGETKQSENLIKELEGDIVTIDGLIAFAGSETGAKVFGSEKAKEVEIHARQIKEAGAAYCDCPACTIVAAILEKKDELLK